MKEHILPALRLTLMCILFFCLVYPLLVLGVARFSPAAGEGERITLNGRTAGYSLEGQSFTDDKYFNGRPSAVAYNAAGSAGSNKGPNDPDYLKLVASRIDSFVMHNPAIKRKDIPAELLTASGSGLDPDLSVQGAVIQVDRIAKKRKLAKEQLMKLIETNTRKPLLGLFGPTTVNVLELNIALDKLN